MALVDNENSNNAVNNQLQICKLDVFTIDMYFRFFRIGRFIIFFSRIIVLFGIISF